MVYSVMEVRGGEVKITSRRKTIRIMMLVMMVIMVMVMPKT